MQMDLDESDMLNLDQSLPDLDYDSEFLKFEDFLRQNNVINGQTFESLLNDPASKAQDFKKQKENLRVLEERTRADDRNIEDLLEFIEGGESRTNHSEDKKKKKKKKKRTSNVAYEQSSRSNDEAFDKENNTLRRNKRIEAGGDVKNDPTKDDFVKENNLSRNAEEIQCENSRVDARDETLNDAPVIENNMTSSMGAIDCISVGVSNVKSQSEPIKEMVCSNAFLVKSKYF